MLRCKLLRGAMDAVFVFLFAVVFALLEIEIEGEGGWAQNLPTARNVLGHLSLYHLLMIVLAVVVVGGFVYFRYAPSSGCSKSTATQQQEGADANDRHPIVHPLFAVLFHLVLYFLVQDFMWFVFNPHYTVKGYTASNVTWHRPWWGGVPAFNFLGLGAVFVISAVTGFDPTLTASLGTQAGLVLLACALSPGYHLFYKALH